MAIVIFFLLLVVIVLLAHLIDRVNATRPILRTPEPDDVHWIVNDNGELGVRIEDRFYFLYKGYSLEYENPQVHEDNTPILWRPVGKREFGECCKPDTYTTGRYTLEPEYIAGLSDGDADQYKWKPLNDSGNTD